MLGEYLEWKTFEDNCLKSADICNLSVTYHFNYIMILGMYIQGRILGDREEIWRKTLRRGTKAAVMEKIIQAQNGQGPEE